MWTYQGVWTWQDRAECISVREMRAICLMLMGSLGKRVKAEGTMVLRLCVDNSSVIHVTNAMVASSRSMMSELRRLQFVLDGLQLQLSTELIPSVLNKFADALSKCFVPGDIAIRTQLRRTVADEMRAPLYSFPLRPLGEHHVFLRQQ
jgi:hypothetical protein